MSGTKKDGFRIALVGNPNVGKSTLFNALTGMKQHVGNWPGVTVEKKVGFHRLQGRDIEIVDLPGMYSTIPYSLDEEVARDFLRTGDADAVIHVVDATNLERNLYLTMQLLEMGIRPVLALSMVDLAREQGILVDFENLSQLLGLHVVPINASRKEGLEELMATTISGPPSGDVLKVEYSKEVNRDIAAVRQVLEDASVAGDKGWLAQNILAGDSTLLDALPDELKSKVEEAMAPMEVEDLELSIVDRRYEVIGNLSQKVQRRPPRKRSKSDRIDSVITHKYLGIPIFLTLMWALFELTFVMSEPFMELIEMAFAYLGELVVENIDGALGSFIGDGIINGVGSVLVFLPTIMILFLLLAVMEESGYLARAAFVMDRIMHSIGLQGKSIIPMLMGFGCNVPAIMATRTIDDDKDRLISILINPFMSCSARLPVYVLFAGIFFSDIAGTVVFSMYILGILVGIGSAKLFRATMFKGEPTPFIMELPCYKTPGIISSLQTMLDKGWIFVRKAGSIIFLAVVILWVLSSFPSGVGYASADSYIGMIGSVIAPIFAPLGFDWKIVVALIFGFLAKEVVIGALGTLYGAAEGAGLEDKLLNDPDITAVTALGLMAFVLLYTPCAAVIGVVRRETGSTKLTLFSVVYGLVVAWVAAFLIWTFGNMMM